MLKLNKSNFKLHLNPELLADKVVVISASLRQVEPLHVQMANTILACEEIKYLRINEYSIEASSHRRYGKNDLPLITATLDENCYVITMIYSFEMQYFSFDIIDLKTEKRNSQFLKAFEKLLPDGWQMMNLL